MTFKVGDEVIIVNSHLYGNFAPSRKGFITRLSMSGGVMVTTKKGLGDHSAYDEDFHLRFNISCIKKYNKEEQMELNFG